MEIIGSSLPYWFYQEVPKGFWQNEMRRVFLQHPIFVGFASQLPRSGDSFVWNGFGKSFIVLRDEDGEIRIFLNSCAHRGSQIHMNSNCKELRCPYHGWSYRLDGSLKKPTIKSRSIGLVESASRVLFDSLIFLWPDQATHHLIDFEQDPLLNQLKLSELQHLEVDSSQPIPVRWPLIAENHLEAYHAIFNHPYYLDLFEGGVVSSSFYRYRTLNPKDARHPLIADYLENARKLPELFPHLPTAMHAGWNFRYLYPSTNLTITPFEIAIDQLVSHGPLSSEIRSYRAGWRNDHRTEVIGLREICDQIDKQIRQEDVDLFIRHQAGVSLHPPQSNSGHLTDQEIDILQFHQQLKKDLPELSLTRPEWSQHEIR